MNEAFFKLLNMEGHRLFASSPSCPPEIKVDEGGRVRFDVK